MRVIERFSAVELRIRAPPPLCRRLMLRPITARADWSLRREPPPYASNALCPAFNPLPALCRHETHALWRTITLRTPVRPSLGQDSLVQAQPRQASRHPPVAE